MPFAARITDMHFCPLTPVVPHVGGPILPSGATTVIIGGLPAATMGDMCTCVGAIDIVITGSSTVTINSKPAARVGDITAHGGSILLGCFTVDIGG